MFSPSPDELRLELQRLLAELKARDQELNDMSNRHSQQLQTWVGEIGVPGPRPWRLLDLL